MRKENRIHWEYFGLLVCIVLAFIVLYYGTHSQSNWFYPSRTLILLFLGFVSFYLGYRTIKHIQRYHIRSFSEIVDSVLSAGWEKQLLVLSFVSIAAFLLSWTLIDSIDHLHWDGDDSMHHESFWLTICYFFDPGNLSLTNHITPGIQGAISLVVAILGMTILTGLFISTFTNIIEQRVESVKSGLITYKSIKNHTVVIGFCDLTESVIRGVLGQRTDERKVLLLTGCDMGLVRKSLFNLTHNKEYDGQIVVYSGDYRIEENLQRLNLADAVNIYILGDDNSTSSDFDNIACSQRVSDIIMSKKDKVTTSPIPMYVRMDRMSSFSVIQRLDIPKGFFSPNVYFRPFNYYDHWARILWVKKGIDILDISGNIKHLQYPTLCFDRKNESQKYIHLVISGFSQMGMALALHALRAAHFGNYSEENNLKTRITVVDPKINELRPIFENQYQNLKQIYDVDLEYMDCMLENLNKEIVKWSCDKEQMLTIAICLSDAETALSQALNLPLEVYFQDGRDSMELPKILVRQKALSGIWQMIEEKEKEHEDINNLQNDAKVFRYAKYNKYHNLHPFGMMVSSFYPDDLDDLKPCLVHIDYEDNWMYQDKEEEDKITISHLYNLVLNKKDEQLREMVNEALKRWYVQSENIKWANRYQTDNHHILLQYLHDANIKSVEDISEHNKDVISLCSDIEHRRWVGERVVSGWQQSPIIKDGKHMRQDSLLLHYDITYTSEIGSEAAKDMNVVKNVLMLNTIYEYLKTIF